MSEAVRLPPADSAPENSKKQTTLRLTRRRIVLRVPKHALGHGKSGRNVRAGNLSSRAIDRASQSSKRWWQRCAGAIGADAFHPINSPVDKTNREPENAGDSSSPANIPDSSTNERRAVMTSYQPRVAFVLGIAFSLSMFLTACRKPTPKTEQAAPPPGQSATGVVPAPSSPATPASAATPASSATPPAPAPVRTAPTPPRLPRIIPAGTSLSTRISSPLGSKTSAAGDRFDGTLVNSVRLNGKVVIPAGSAVSGVVVTAHSAGKFKGAASLAVRLTAVNVNGKSYPIRSNTISQETTGKGKRTGALVGGGAGGGALIGGLAGGGKGAVIGGLVGAGAGTVGAAVTGNTRDISYPAETVLAFRLRNSLNLDAGTAANSADPPPPSQE